jgi:hypothetical protein
LQIEDLKTPRHPIPQAGQKMGFGTDDFAKLFQKKIGV